MVASILFSGIFYTILVIAIFLDIINFCLYIKCIISEIRYRYTGLRRRVPSAAPVAATLFYIMFLPYGVFVNASLGKPFFPISTELRVGLLLLVAHALLHFVFITICRLTFGFSRQKNN
jgi:hypothetical protein